MGQGMGPGGWVISRTPENKQSGCSRSPPHSQGVGAPDVLFLNPAAEPEGKASLQAATLEEQVCGEHHWGAENMDPTTFPPTPEFHLGPIDGMKGWELHPVVQGGP